MKEMLGGCTCRKIRYRLKREPMFVNCCNCTWCQRETGSAFVINAVMEAKETELLGGTPEIIDTPSASGKGQKIHRCPECKVAVWSNYGGAGPILNFVRVGTLDNPNQCPPNAIIFTSTKQDWVCYPDNIPQFEEYYDMKALYSSEAWERREALKPDIAAWKASGQN